MLFRAYSAYDKERVCGSVPQRAKARGSALIGTEKRGGLNLVSFDWSPFKLFSLSFSKESVQCAYILPMFEMTVIIGSPP